MIDEVANKILTESTYGQVFMDYIICNNVDVMRVNKNTYLVKDGLDPIFNGFFRIDKNQLSTYDKFSKSWYDAAINFPDDILSAVQELYKDKRC